MFRKGILFSSGIEFGCVGRVRLMKCWLMKVDRLVLKIDSVRLVVIWLVVRCSVS